MTEPLHILVHCRKSEMIPAATLIFKTLRTGFPEAPVYLWCNDRLCGEDAIHAAARETDAQWVTPQCPLQHDHWIRYLIQTRRDPFWICDTDVVFWKRFEHAPDPACDALAGVRMPAFYEPWTRTRYRERLHPCLMRIAPEHFKARAAAFAKGPENFPWTPQVDFVAQQWQAERKNGTVQRHFYDTLAMAWHAFGGQEFTKEQIESFDHLNCATYADLIAPALDFDILGAHKAVYEDFRQLKGSWAQQFQWFAEHKDPPCPSTKLSTFTSR